ncbi:MAG: efflux RND transporter periplasmic adaptor subunit [Planctomycetota bacterium]
MAWFALAESPLIARAQPPLQISDALVTISQQVRVPTLSEGAITRLLVAEGDVVMVGQLLAQMDDREPRLALARAKSELETAIKAAESELEIRLATKKHELAKSDLTRIEKARSMLTGSVADEEFENRRLQVERTGLEIDKSKEDRQNAIAQAELHANDFRSAELALERTKVTAPLSGVIVSVERREGEWCKTGETILEILGTSKLRAEAMIDASEIRQSLVGRRVALFPDMNDGSDRKFLGVLRFENPEINPVDNRVSVWAEIDNSDGRLRPGMRGRMYIEMSGRVDPPTPALPSPPTTSRLQSTPAR